MTYNDNVKAAVWCQDGQLALAVRDEYSLLTVFQNDQKDQVPGNSKYLFTTGNKSSAPIIRPLSDTGVIGFCRDEIMYFVTLSGRPAETIGYGHVRWSQIPIAVEYDRPFLLALFVTSIEIRSAKSSQLIQTVTLQRPQLIKPGEAFSDQIFSSKSQSGGIVFEKYCNNMPFSTNCISSWSYFSIDNCIPCSSGCLHVVSNPTSNQTDLYCLDGTGQLLKNNIEKLLKDKDYELAWHLAKNLDEKVVNQKEKDERISEIRNLYAFHLFEQRRFKDSMSIFGEINAEVLYVIGLFPDLLPEDVRKSIKYPGPIPTDFAKNERIQGLQALSEYLSMVRTNIAKELENFEKRKNKFTSRDFENLAINAIKDEKSATQQKNLLQIVDTTLLKCYLQTNDMLVASLLRLPDNRCDVAECENILLKSKKINELFLLYERKELHESALELLKSQFNLKDSPLRGLSRTIHYLQNLGDNYLPLIFQYAKWVIKENSSDALKIFTEDCSEVRALDRRKVLEFLIKEAQDQVVPYLEHIIAAFDENSPEIKDALVRHCFNRVQKHMSEYFSGLQGICFSFAIHLVRLSDYNL
uniref:CNH domain-containing protein n=1 Tax=Romanomermis culicivorax TaxID=13658 RepID=A0A915IVF3_ROMCU